MSSNSLKFLTWNLCLFHRSDDAPTTWREDQTEHEVRKRVIATGADIVCFQELPGIIPYVETHDLVPANTYSHSGHIATILRKELVDSMTCRLIHKCAVLTIFPKLNLTIANVHLAPGKNEVEKRHAAVRTIIAQCNTDALLILGDTNTRVSEEASMAGFGLKGNRPPRPTWDSRRNGFRRNQQNGRRFSAYFTRYFHTADLRVNDVRVFDQPILEGDHQFFLSDHFALFGNVTVNLTGAQE
ncbi:MAG: hypothetical protein AAFN77_19515 [Planctomycetota bacterium]